MSPLSPVKAQRRPLHDRAEVEAARGMMLPALATDLPLEVFLSRWLVASLGPWLIGEAFLRIGLIGEETKY